MAKGMIGREREGFCTVRWDILSIEREGFCTARHEEIHKGVRGDYGVQVACPGALDVLVTPRMEPAQANHHLHVHVRNPDRRVSPKASVPVIGGGPLHNRREQ
jgi:hypothetical protein